MASDSDISAATARAGFSSYLFAIQVSPVFCSKSSTRLGRGRDDGQIPFVHPSPLLMKAMWTQLNPV